MQALWIQPYTAAVSKIGYNPFIRTSRTTDMNEKLWMLTAGSILINLNILHHWQCRNCAARKSWPGDLYSRHSRPGCERN
eukprot:5541971-Karenia_brevis.AAC.1